MEFGIDAMTFYTSKYYLDLEAFALGRNESPSKFKGDFGQYKMSVSAPNEDVVTMAANAVHQLLEHNGSENLEMVIFATESGIDAAKSAATYIHSWFNLPKRCRVVELKQACYGATFGLQLALSWLKQNTDKKVLLIASDIATYALKNAAESSQGCGAIAMLLSANPRLIAIENYSGFCTMETMDFWRPNYLNYSLVDGRLSCNVYMRMAEESFKQYLTLSGRDFHSHDYFCYHMPFARLVEVTHKRLAKLNQSALPQEFINHQIRDGLVYGREVGNCYTASLYLDILSLLENSNCNMDNGLVGLYSYGSGSVAEFFCGRISKNFRSYLPRPSTREFLDLRFALTFDEYEEFQKIKLSCSGEINFPKCWETGLFGLEGVSNHRRIYRSKAYFCNGLHNG